MAPRGSITKRNSSVTRMQLQLSDEVGLDRSSSKWSIVGSMPVPTSRLQEAQKPIKERVLEVLQKDPNQGFSVVDLYTAIEARELYKDPATSQAWASLALTLLPPAARTAKLKP